MSNYNAKAGWAIPGGDITVHNYGASSIPANTAVLWDTTAGHTNGVVIPTASAGVVGTAGVTVVAIAAGADGTMRVAGGAPVTLGGTIAAGDWVSASDVTGHMGEVVKCASHSEQLGQCVIGGAATEQGVILIVKSSYSA